MQELVKNAKHVPLFLPSWTPNFSQDSVIADHISQLCIPSVSGQPSLLLHDLGAERDDLDEARVKHMFSLGHHTCVIRDLVNFLHNLVILGYSSTRLDPAKPGYCSRACVVSGDSISLQSQIRLVWGRATFGRLWRNLMPMITKERRI